MNRFDVEGLLDELETSVSGPIGFDVGTFPIGEDVGAGPLAAVMGGQAALRGISRNPAFDARLRAVFQGWQTQGGVPKAQLSRVLGILAQAQGQAQAARQVAVPGFGRPSDAGSGSTGIPVGLGTTGNIAQAAAITLTQNNNRGAILRLRRIVLSGGGFAANVITPNLGNARITAVTLGEAPLLSGGAVGIDVFARDNFSPIGLNHLWYPGVPLTVTGVAAALQPATVAVTGTAEVEVVG